MPSTSRIVNGVEVPLSQAELDELAGLAIAAIGPRREQRRAEFRAAAGARIAALFAQPPGSLELAWKQINMLSSLVALLWLERKGAVTQAQAAPQLDAALALFSGAIQPIRDAENAASLALDAAGTDEQMTPAERVAEIDAVTPEWPA